MVLPDLRSPRRFPAADPARPPPPVECPAPSHAAPRLRPLSRPVPARPLPGCPAPVRPPVSAGREHPRASIPAR